MFTLTDVQPVKGATKKKKRAARGNAGYGGKTAGKGMNGQKSRKSPDVRKQFEGGQTPLYRRLPKKQAMPAFNHVEYTILNVGDLSELKSLEGKEVTPELLLELRIIRKIEKGGVKILGNGDCKAALKIKAHKVSKSAMEKIAKAGGSIEILQ